MRLLFAVTMCFVIGGVLFVAGCGVQAPADVPEYNVISEQESNKGVAYKVETRTLDKQDIADITQDLASQHGDAPLVMVMATHPDKLTLATAMFVADRDAWNEYAVEEFQEYPDTYPVIAVKTTYRGH